MAERTARALALQKILAVARHEFVSTVTRLGYVLTLVGLPLFVGATSTFSGLIASRAVFDKVTRPTTLGVVDESGLFARAPDRAEMPLDLERILPAALRGGSAAAPAVALQAAKALVSAELRRFPSLDAARGPLLAGELDAVVRIPKDWLQSGKLEEYRRSRRGVDLAKKAGGAPQQLRGWLISGLLQDRVDPAVAARASRPGDWTTFAVEPDGQVAEQDFLRELRPFAVPLGFSLLLMLSIFVGASFLATGLAEEKQNRALEMLLTSLTAEQLFWGKLLGIWLAAFLQFAIYLALVALPAALAFAALGIKLSLVLIAFAYFVLGFFFFGAVLLAIGAIGNTQRYTQQLASVFTFLAVVPFLVLPAILDQPGGALARTFSFIPFSAPITGMLRAAAGALPWWELLLSLASLGLGTVVAVRVCSRIFRVALLATGNVPSLKQVWAWMRDAR